ncbi:MAG: DUF1329 domain-containing protein [Thermodesulfobacteriota bacterium]|nr:DUF1329 domain-containing protein [Thermodesulfobacteriota bacterium]
MRHARLFVFTVILLGFLVSPAWADVAPGDVITKDNAQKIDGLVPDFIMDAVKKGDLTMNIGKLDFDKKGFWPKEVLENWDSNIGKYKLDENNGIVDAATGEKVRGVKGLPFPEPDPKDPNMVAQLMWNTVFMEYFVRGDCHQLMRWFSVNRSGLEKKLLMENYCLPADKDRSRFDYIQLSVLKEPFNIAGTGTLVHYALYPMDGGMRFVWTPELRKIRRVSHRLSGTEEHFGLDNGPDDYWSGGPRSAMEQARYQFIEEKDALVPYVSSAPQKLVKKGDALVGGDLAGNKKLKVGFEDPEWKGAPWNLTNIIWVKTKVYVFNSDSTDPNYSYGTCQGWVEKGTCVPSYKIINDKNGKLWKGQYWCGAPFSTEDGSCRFVFKWGQVMVNMRRDHGSTYCGPFRDGCYMKTFSEGINKKNFTRAGFAKFSR